MPRSGISPTNSGSRPITLGVRSGSCSSEEKRSQPAFTEGAPMVEQSSAPSWIRRAGHYRMLRECRYEDLIRTDFSRLFAFSAGASGHLLDAGCGTGNETVNLRRQAPRLRIYGVDVSPAALAIAVTRPETSDSIFYRSALESLPFPDGVFDYIASHEVIEHVEDPAVVLREFSRVLKPAGVCVIATPNGASLWIEHLRQRVMRLCGRRGAPVGADHTRPPSFWRHEWRRARVSALRRAGSVDADAEPALRALARGAAGQLAALRPGEVPPAQARRRRRHIRGSHAMLPGVPCRPRRARIDARVRQRPPLRAQCRRTGRFHRARRRAGRGGRRLPGPDFRNPLVHAGRAVPVGSVPAAWRAVGAKSFLCRAPAGSDSIGVRCRAVSPTASTLIKTLQNSWLGREDSNLRMAESKSAALPLGYAPTALA